MGSCSQEYFIRYIICTKCMGPRLLEKALFIGTLAVTLDWSANLTGKHGGEESFRKRKLKRNGFTPFLVSENARKLPHFRFSLLSANGALLLLLSLCCDLQHINMILKNPSRRRSGGRKCLKTQINYHFYRLSGGFAATHFTPKRERLL